MIKKVNSWDTFLKILKLAENIKFSQNVVKTIFEKIHDSFYWDKKKVINFLSSSEEILGLSYSFVSSRYAPKNERSIEMMENVLEAIKMFIDKNRSSATQFLKNLKLNELILKEKALNVFSLPIKNIINSQLAMEDCWIDLLDAYFKNLNLIEDKSIEKVKDQIPMLALYWYTKNVKLEYKQAYITNYLESFFCQFESVSDWTDDAILDFFKATFSFIPEIKEYFNTILDKLISDYDQTISSLEKTYSESSQKNKGNLRKKIASTWKIISLADQVRSLEINYIAQFNYLKVDEFEYFIDQYIDIIKNKDVPLLFEFYTKIENYLKDLTINKITYKDSKNREIIAKYFIFLIRDSLTDLFKTYLEESKTQEKNIAIINKASLASFETMIIEEIKNFLNLKNISVIEESETQGENDESINKAPPDLIEAENIIVEEIKDSSDLQNKKSSDLIEAENKIVEEKQDFLNLKSISPKELEFQEESDKLKLESMIQRVICGDKKIINSQFWIDYLESREIQAIQVAEFRSSFLHKIVFSVCEENFALKQYLASHMTRLFKGTLNETDKNFFIEAKQRAVKLYFIPPKKIDTKQKKEFKQILYSLPVKEAFQEENLWNDKIKKLVKRTYFADIPDNLSGITVFGGTILLHQSLSKNNDFKSCAKKITFIHEAAHAMRKYNDGAYNAVKKTPKSFKDLRSGMPGNSELSAKLKDADKDEGGKIIENAIFGAFFTRINNAQIEYINNLSNWKDDRAAFRASIEANGKVASKTYELARGTHYISGIRCNDCERY